MLTRLTNVILVAALAAAPLPVVAVDDPVRLKPSSKWVIDYAPDYCRLMRSFGVEDQTITLIMDRFGPGNHFRLNIVGAPMRAKNERLEAKLRFGSSEQVMQLSFFRGSMDKQPAWVIHHLFWIQTDSAAPTPAQVAAEEAKIDEVFIGSPLRQPVILDTGSFGPPFAALRKCTDELLTDWGLDPSTHADMQQYATPSNNPAKWVTHADYPYDRMKDSQQALVEFRLIVGTNGAVESCTIQQSSHPAFGDVVCSAVKRRATFNAALNRDGAPIRSFYRNRVLFKLTGSEEACPSGSHSVQCAKQ